MRRHALLILLALPASLAAKDRIAYVDFFGYKGIDVEAVRQALPFREGDAASPDVGDRARSAVKRMRGRDATDVANICCTSDGDFAIFIGLPGNSSKPFPLNSPPTGKVTPSPELVRLYEAMQKAEFEAIQKGRFQEDGTPGFRSLKEPAAKAGELALRNYALGHEEELLSLLSTANAEQRAMGADALGFGQRTPRQLNALVLAVRDPNENVRNNATRALGEILRGDPAAASQVSPDSFIEMLRSETWTDRNKASMVLLSLTQSRDPQLLARVRSEADDALQEMASWRATNWALPARAIQARIDGKSDASVMLEGSAFGMLYNARWLLLGAGFLGAYMLFRYFRGRRVATSRA